MPSRAPSPRSTLLLTAVALIAGLSACGASPTNTVVGSGGGSAPTKAPVTSAPSKPSSCPLIPGLPHTENGIFELTASGTTCATATILGRQALQTHQGKAFAADGFTCTSWYDTRGYRGYPSYRYTCTAGAQQVTFVYSR